MGCKSLSILDCSMINKKESVILCSLALVLSACTVGPDFIRPGSKLAEKWSGEKSEPATLPQAEKQKTDIEWWKNFNDPTLTSLIEQAHKNNPTLQIAAVRIFQARAQYNISKGEIFPQTQVLTGSLNFQRLSNNSTNLVDQNLGTSDLGFQLGWELDFWGKYRRGIQAGHAGYYASTAAYDDALITLVADVSKTYVNIRILEERLRVANNNIVLQTESYRIAKARFEGGETSQLDLEQASTQLNQTKATIPQLTLNLKKQKNALGLLLGETPDKVDSYLGENSAIPQPPDTVFTGVPIDLLRQRPDVRNAEYTAAKQSANIGVAKASLYPSFSLNGFFGTSANNNGNASLNDVFNWDNAVLSGGGSFLFPVFNYGRITNQVRVQDAVFQQALLDYQNQVLAAQKEVEDGLAEYNYSTEQADFLSKATTSSKEASRLSMLQYKAGQTDFTTVLNAEQAELSNEDSYVSAKGNIVLGAIAIYRALGGGWEIRNNKELIPEEMKATMQQRTNWGKMLSPTPTKTDTPPKDKP